MRTVTYGGACSLDGFIAGPRGEIDWLHHSRDVQRIMANYWKTIDTVVVGRKTLESAMTMGSAESGGLWSSVKSYVCSRTLNASPHADVELVSDDAGDFVRRLKTSPGKGICIMGGGELAGSLFAAGVIDEVGFNMHPILLGAGIPALRDAGRRVPLDLIGVEPIDGGCVYTRYRVVH